MQDHAFVGFVETVHWANCHARSVGAVHTSDRDGLLARYTIVQSDNATAVHAPRHFVFVFTSGDATVALDATLCVTNKFHACHLCFSFNAAL
jgi:hypothetical protein